MGRRRKKRHVIRPARRIIPKIFNCPNCGAQAVMVRVDRGKSSALVTCGYCNLSWHTEMKSFEERVDVYSRFVDVFLEGEIAT